MSPRRRRRRPPMSLLKRRHRFAPWPTSSRRRPGLSSVRPRTRSGNRPNSGAEHAAQGLRSLAGELQALSQGRPQEAERLAGWVRSGQQRLQQWSDRLDRGGIDGVVQDLTSFARRRPLAFLGACLRGGLSGGPYREGHRRSLRRCHGSRPALGADGDESGWSRPPLPPERPR